MSDDIFRREVVDNHDKRLHGKVILRSSVSSKAITLFIALIVCVAIIAAALAHYARTEPARGVLTPVEGLAKIYAVRAGVVGDLMVKEGDYVKAGDPLALIRLENPNEAGSFETVVALDSLREQSALAVERLKLSREKSIIELARLTQTIDGLRAQESTLKEQINLQQQVVASTTATFDQLSSVVTNGFVSKLEYERRRQASLASKQELLRLQQQLVATQSDIVRTNHERAGLRLDGQTQGAAAKSTIEELRQERSRAEAGSSYLIEAPRSGRVTALQASVGKTVTASLPVMAIIPGGRLLVDVYVPSRAIGFIETGQQVSLLYDAYPYQRFGSFRGRVTSVSRTAMAGSETDAPFKIDEPVYRVVVEPDRQSVFAFGKSIPLQPGMTLVANIIIERQTFAQWLISPLRAVINRS